MMTRRILMATGMAAAMATAGASAMAESMMTTRAGTFEGRSNHVASGSVEIVEEGDRTFVVLGEDFSLDGGPDPRVAFGSGGEYDPDTKLGALLSLNGKQRYAVPPTWSASDYSEVFIWCETAGVPLAVASLK